MDKQRARVGRAEEVRCPRPVQGQIDDDCPGVLCDTSISNLSDKSLNHEFGLTIVSACNFSGSWLPHIEIKKEMTEQSKVTRRRRATMTETLREAKALNSDCTQQPQNFKLRFDL